jgi:hypothetical protein
MEKVQGVARRAGLYMLMASLLVGVFWNGGYFPTSKLVFAGLLIAAGSWEVMIIVSESQWRAFRSPALWLFGIFAAAAVASHAWTSSTEITDREAAMAIGLVAAFLIARAQALRFGGQAVAAMLNWFVYTGAFVAFWGIITYLLRVNPYMQVVDGILRAGSTFEYSNALSCFELMALAITLALHQKIRPGERPLYATVASIQIAVTILALSRSGLVLLVLLLAYFLATAWRRRLLVETVMISLFGLLIGASCLVAGEAEQKEVGLVLAALLVAASFFAQRTAGNDRLRKTFGLFFKIFLIVSGIVSVVLVAISDRAQVILRARFVEGFHIEKLLPARVDTWEAGINAFRQKPAQGWGLGMYAELYGLFLPSRFSRYVHNTAIQMAADTGIIGGLPFALFLLYAAAVACWRILRSSDLLIKALGIGILIFVFWNMFDFEWYLPAIAAWFMVAVAFVEADISVADAVLAEEEG